MGDASLGLVAAVVAAIDGAIWTEVLTVTGHVADVAVWAASVHVIVGIALPFIGVAMMTRFVGEKRSVLPSDRLGAAVQPRPSSRRLTALAGR